MNDLRCLYVLLIVSICCIHPSLSQPLLFSTDTAILNSCDTRPPEIARHYIYNTTDEAIGLGWNRTTFQVPEESDYLMILDGIQYFPFVSKGIRYLDAEDSMDLIFSFWHDTLVPGDSVIVQIVVYDIEDSLNTSHLLTFIQHCPLQTGVPGPVSNDQIVVFPNPVIDEMIIRIPEHSEATSLVLFSSYGVIRTWPLSSSEIALSRHGIPSGLYYLGMESNGRITGVRKILFLN
jgi:hypothetical protein